MSSIAIYVSHISKWFFYVALYMYHKIVCIEKKLIKPFLHSFSLARNSFKQLVDRPTHVEGGILDQLYVRKLDVVDVSLHHPYYSDHDAIVAMFQTLET